MKTTHTLIAALGAVLVAGSAHAYNVILNVDSSYEGLALPGQIPLTSGLYRVGWFDTGTTNTQLQNWASSGDLASIEGAFNEVFAFSNMNSNGNGLPFETTVLVADGDGAGLDAYKNPSSGAAGKQVYAWIWNASVISSVTAHAIVTTSASFGLANAIDGSDYNTDFGTSWDTPGVTAVVGSLEPVVFGSGVDLNQGSPADSRGRWDGPNVLTLAAVPEPSSALLILGGLGAMALRRRRA